MRRDRVTDLQTKTVITNNGRGDYDHTRRWIDGLRDARWRRPITAGLLILLVVLSLFGTSVRTSGSGIAQAGNCTFHGQRWRMVAPPVNFLDYGKVRFGATVCEDGARITSTTPYLTGGVEGAGTTTGFVWTSMGSWVVEQSDHYVHIHGQAKAKMCVAGHYTPLCSMTDTQDFDLVFYNVYGPYLPGREPHITATSHTRDMLGGTAPMTRFIPN